MIIGITGTLGAGKGSVVSYLQSKGFNSYSSSQLLGELVEKEGNPKTREFLSPMATFLQQEYPGGVVEKNYREKYVIEKPELVIFEAIHRQSEATFLKSVGGIIIGVDADLETRYERTVARNESEKDQVTFADFKQHSLIEDEGVEEKNRDNNIREVMSAADYVIENDSTLEYLHTQIEAVLAEIAQKN